MKWTTNWFYKFSSGQMRVFVVMAATCFSLVSASAQSYSVLYRFTGGTDGSGPLGPLARDRQDNLYGTTFGGSGTGAPNGTVFQIAATGKERTLYMFSGGIDGGTPGGGLVRDGSNLYGTTTFGGNNACNEGKGCGVLFRVSAQGAETALYIFTLDESYPTGNLIRDSKGNLYGASFAGGPDSGGAVFELTSTGTEKDLYYFTSYSGGESPERGLVRDSQGNLYGSDISGGLSVCPFGCGVVFEISPNGEETVLHSFDGTDGYEPFSTLVRDEQGNLYGAAIGGGGHPCGANLGCGVVFEVTIAGVEKVLYAFTGGSDGTAPTSLVRDNQGNLYGTATNGGAFTNLCPYGCGVVFEITSDGVEKVLHAFTSGGDGASPGSLTLDEQGNLYGTTTAGGGGYKVCPGGCGTVFKLTL